MASAFGHVFASLALGSVFRQKMWSWKFWLLGSLCTILPDADVIGFQFGIAYESFWGHRGFSHSLLFALLWGMAVTVLFYRTSFRKWTSLLYILYFTLCTASHALLDAMTTGGHGVAFFSPWNNDRYFLPWRPIKVSPIGVENFFGERGMAVLQSELVWVMLPCAIWGLAFITIKLVMRRKA